MSLHGTEEPSISHGLPVVVAKGVPTSDMGVLKEG